MSILFCALVLVGCGDTSTESTPESRSRQRKFEFIVQRFDDGTFERCDTTASENLTMNLFTSAARTKDWSSTAGLIDDAYDLAVRCGRETTQSAPLDVCLNLAGVQAITPAGWTNTKGVCKKR
jgi:hypothetical protein